MPFNTAKDEIMRRVTEAEGKRTPSMVYEDDIFTSEKGKSTAEIKFTRIFKQYKDFGLDASLHECMTMKTCCKKDMKK
jgi:hypothetical protein